MFYFMEISDCFGEIVFMCMCVCVCVFVFVVFCLEEVVCCGRDGCVGGEACVEGISCGGDGEVLWILVFGV